MKKSSGHRVKLLRMRHKTGKERNQIYDLDENDKIKIIIVINL